MATAVIGGKPAQLIQHAVDPLMLQRVAAWTDAVKEPTMRWARAETPFVVAIGGGNAPTALRDADGWAHYRKGKAWCRAQAQDRCALFVA